MSIALQPNGTLPPGIHILTWAEFEALFGWNAHRQRLLAGLRRAIADLKIVGCQTLYVDGSFVTSKDIPGDFDACWDRTGVDMLLLMQTPLGSFQNFRADQKAAYQGELFPADSPANGTGTVFLNFFQIDKTSGDPKGIVMLDLRGMQ